ncbi:MAG: radical SAM protein [Candidatus Aenigmarchaeota archaeon]|nr:radical SAM protein [Candidatus Aenigmarchaeota archaeon]
MPKEKPFKIGKTHSICPKCNKILPAELLVKDNKVYISKTCKKHGRVEDLYSGDYDIYKRFEKWAHDGKGIENPFVKSKPVCPKSCGLCKIHKSHTALGNIAITNRCDLQCFYCFFYAQAMGYVYEPMQEQICDMLRAMATTKPVGANAVQLTGGEPMLRDDLIDIIKIAKEEGYEHIQLNTNGIRLSNDNELAKKVREAGINTIYLSFDGVTARTNPKNHWEIPGIMKNCREAGIGIVLVPTVINSINDHEVGDILEFGLKNIDIIRGVNYQPVSLVGRITKADVKKYRITIPDVIKGLEEQTEGMVTKDDFFPVPTVTALTHFVEAVTKKPHYELTTHFACIDGSEKIVIFNSNKPRIESFSELADFIEREGRFVKYNDVEVADISDLNYKVPSLKKSVLIKKFMRRHGKKIYKIRTVGGREIKLTADHVVFIKGDEGIEEKAVKNLSLDNELVCCNNLDVGKETDQIDLIKEFTMLDEKITRRIYIRKVKKELKARKIKKSWKKFFEDAGLNNSQREIYAWLYRDTLPFSIFLQLDKYHRFERSNLKLGAEVSGKELPLILHISPELMRLVGYFISEGNYHTMSGEFYRLNISNSNKEIIKDIEMCLKVLGWSYKINYPHGRPQISINGKIYGLLFKEIFKIGKRANKKSLPKFALSLPKRLVIELMVGLFSGDGWVQESKNKNSLRICYKTTSRDLMIEMTYLLSKFNIRPRIWFKKTGGTETTIEKRKMIRKSDTWVVSISRWDNVKKLIMEGFVFADEKRNKILNSIKPTRKFVYEKSDYIFEKIKELETTDHVDKYVYDIEVEEPHGFFCNGILIHNCGAATYLFKEDDGRVVPLPRFVDVNGLMEYLDERANDINQGKSKTWAMLKTVRNIGRFINKEKQPKGLKLSSIFANILVRKDYSALGLFHKKSLFVGMMHFMDKFNFDIERVKRCCVHYAVPDGRILPFCTFNVIPELYRDVVQKRYGMSIKDWEKKTGRKLQDDFYKRDPEKMKLAPENMLELPAQK